MGFLRNFAGLVSSNGLAAAIAYATGLELFGLVCVGIQWVVALVHAIPAQNEQYFDLTGSVTFAIVSLLALVKNEQKTWRSALLTAMVSFWCVRLGSFLFFRIRGAGSDSRFEKIRGNPLRFLSVWSIQGLWVFLTLLAVLLFQRYGNASSAVTIFDIVGGFVWLTGYVIEVLADHQKTIFRADARNKDKFITHGLWAYSRHPNYFGEIVMWVGIFLMAVHTLPTTTMQYTAAVSPAFVTLLLTKVSGIPLLEKQADKKWGDNKQYQEYKARTSVLMLLPPSKK
ncbi:TPA: hypothetical protein N0F65_004039 [Lagenidium giganteum]|uniref:Steroid 5-alpha reductase C-terminal domain-containing protein n=1 Tax=Lagenidium giganteum TaxID=4803 RepID=A0AAV2YBT9_9STRA|nr:TPA: hypothetical protein N0F65_004039 [Lagenidium giganteum]